MSIKQQENLLFEEWKKKQGYSYFISDGVFDEDEWNRQDYKILFVLKEANWENGNVDLCKYLLSEPKSPYWKTWNNIARWTKAILIGGEYPKRVTKKDKTYWLRKIAAINLKKIGGGSAAQDKIIGYYAKKDRIFIKRQIELYKPDIIICCGRGKGKNADILHDVIFSDEEVSEWKKPVLQYNYFYIKMKEKGEVPVVSFYHPQMIGSHSLFAKRYEEMKVLAHNLCCKE